MITLEQYEQIRRMYHLEEKSGRQIARELSCSRQTVSRALSLEQPPAYTMSRPRLAPVLGPYQAKLEELPSRESAFTQETAVYRSQVVSIDPSRRIWGQRSGGAHVCGPLAQSE